MKTLKVGSKVKMKSQIADNSRGDDFDYTQWRRDLWKDKSIEEIHNMAVNFAKNLKQ